MLKIEHFPVIRRHPSRPGVFTSKCLRCEDKRGHVEVDTRKMMWHCKRCWRGGLLEGHARTFAIAPRPALDAAPFEKKLEMYGPHYRFLLSRGFCGRTIEELDPRYGPEPSMVYFPIRDQHEHVIYFVGRYIFNSGDRRWWFSSAAPGKSSCMWGLHRIRGMKEIVIVEGVFDAVWHPNRLAIFGTRISREQIRQIAALRPDRVTVALDPGYLDDAIILASTLAQRITTRIMLWDPKDEKRDPCELGPQGSELIRTQSRRFM